MYIFLIITLVSLQLSLLLVKDGDLFHYYLPLQVFKGFLEI